MEDTDQRQPNETEEMFFVNGQEVKLGYWVRHYGTLAWGKVTEIVKQRDKTLEMRVEREGNPEDMSCWASYHVDVVSEQAPTKKQRELGRAWRPLGGIA